MHIKAIVFGAAITLAGVLAVASAQAAEGFTVLDGVSADRLSPQEMAAVQGTGGAGSIPTVVGNRGGPPPPGQTKP